MKPTEHLCRFERILPVRSRAPWRQHEQHKKHKSRLLVSVDFCRFLLVSVGLTVGSWFRWFPWDRGRRRTRATQAHTPPGRSRVFFVPRSAHALTAPSFVVRRPNATCGRVAVGACAIKLDPSGGNNSDTATKRQNGGAQCWYRRASPSPSQTRAMPAARPAACARCASARACPRPRFGPARASAVREPCRVCGSAKHRHGYEHMDARARGCSHPG